MPREPSAFTPGSVYLGRIDPTVYPSSQAFFIDTAMGPQIAPVGWLLNNADCTAGAHLQFGEFGSTGLSGVPLSTAHDCPAHGN